VERIGTEPSPGDRASKVSPAVTQQLERLRKVEERLADLAKSVTENQQSLPADFVGAEAERSDEPEPEPEPKSGPASGSPAPRGRRWRRQRGKSRA
jgi:hypothetical protein